jgi:hypothetical protein
MIKTDWDKVRENKGKGWSARAFAPITQLELSSLDISRILDKKIDTYHEERNCSPCGGQGLAA